MAYGKSLAEWLGVYWRWNYAVHLHLYEKYGADAVAGQHADQRQLHAQ